ncbi:DUF2963 domain-containing protein, partial [Candidatus Phytoplasma sp. Tabriz.2]|nr:DUF2963 domain-containing protein [Candidatus Phytoplasma australiense]
IWYIIEYNPQNGKSSKRTVFNKDGSIESTKQF